MVAGAHHREGDPCGPQEPEDLREPRPAYGRHHETDDQRVGRVEARHRRVRVRGQRHDLALLVDRAQLRERVREAPLGEHPGWGRRHQHVHDQAEHVREDQPVPEVGEALVVPEVDPEQRCRDHGELRQPVRVRRGGDEHARALDEILHGRLDEHPQPVLGLDDQRAVPERLADSAVGDAPRRLIRHVKAQPYRDLDEQMRPTTRQPACLRVPGHDFESIAAG